MEKLSILQYFFIQAYELEEINKNKVNDKCHFYSA